MVARRTYSSKQYYKTRSISSTQRSPSSRPGSLRAASAVQRSNQPQNGAVDAYCAQRRCVIDITLCVRGAVVKGDAVLGLDKLCMHHSLCTATQPVTVPSVWQ